MVRFAPGLDLPPAARPRRTSSAGTAGTGRRGSIYQRFQGGYTDGVDAGVGSKARTLSVAIPHELYVDECRLAEHFSVLSRAGKKDIGEGGAAVVHLMQSKTAGPGKVFAVKAFRDWEPDEELEREYVRKIKSEYAIAKSLEHPNIIQTYRLCHSDKKWFHVMEYCDLGDLNDLINKGYFSREDRNCMFKQLLRGVEYLHSRGIAHRDLKSENLLLTSTGCLKLADFGTAEVFSGMHPGLRGCRRQSLVKEEDEVRLCAPGLVGSRPYMAPEIIEHEDRYDPRAVDIWSCAIVYLTLCIGGTPWEFASTDVKNYNIFCSTWDTWYERYPDRLLTKERVLPAFAYTKQFAMLDDMGTKCLVMGMLHPDPSKRWSAKDVLESKTVVDYPCCQQDGYSDDIKTRQRKAMHNHCPPKPVKGSKFLKPK
ncbi:kinase-like domain-containing protein [Neohortaea acidophila]|uniref:non-specific serine/threonine protein kinase n=1 Tax=Neohortaea acidophila TaxID=245834 RepID=A0A6A6PSH8_9PEZI|nr:kinase-like domain-containing protein [Neohortaea acidophila]KAF2482835.1 kinase-like domain-containing protein [Neohortaea acidophila]